MNVLITGGAGFIGSNLVDRMLNDGHRVVALDNFDAFYERAIKEANLRDAQQNDQFRLIEGDIRNKSLISQILEEEEIELVIHLAAKAGVRPSLLNPAEYYDVNLNGTLAILEAMRDRGLKDLVFASSSSVYGNNKKVPFSEDDFVDFPISPYAASKKAGELLCHTYSHLYKFNITCLRFFTVYGPRQRPEMAIHNFTRKIYNEDPIVMFGDGSSQRDYTYVEDILDGILKAMDQLSGYHIYNLGESQTIALRDLIRDIEKALNKKAIIDQQPMQAGDVDRTFADIKRACDEIGYLPRTKISEGIGKFVNWFVKQADKQLTL